MTSSRRPVFLPQVIAAAAFTIVAVIPGYSQNQPAARSFIGTVTSVSQAADRLEIKPDNAAPISVSVSAGTTALKIAPGEKDLKKAQAIQLSAITVGDRVLVTLSADSTEARRVIVMSAADIAKRDEAERLDWMRRGVSGVVAAKTGNQVTLRMRTFRGPVEATVTVDERTTFKRYAPDSVKFADAKPSSLAEINIGDQLRARGQKSDDGLKVAAEEIVFGTFLTRAGTITSINPEAKEVTVKELGTDKTLLIKLTADSQLKKMPDFGGMMPGAGRPGFQSGNGYSQSRGEHAAGAPGGGAGPGGGPREISQMLERMPATTIGDLKQGETIVVSSTKGARPDQLTAIMLVANADMLIRMASAQAGSGRAGGVGGGRGMNGGMMGQMDGLGGLDMPGMFP